MEKSWAEESQKKVIQPSNLKEKVQQLREEGKTLVTLNGSFDLLHAGHLHMLFEASQLANILIVALNSDASIQQYKSSERPIIPLRYRIEMMTALGFVDYVTWFEETDPCALLEVIQPDVHVNGPEWGKRCIEADTVQANGGKIHIASLVPGLSTTAIVDKIHTLQKKESSCV